MTERQAEVTAAAPADEDSARTRVRALLQWAEEELDLLSSAFRGCIDEQRDQVAVVQRVTRLPGAYDEFLRVAGVGGVGSAIAEIFPGDDVDVDSLLPNDEWLGLRALADEIAAAMKGRLDLTGHVVIRLHRQAAFEYVDGALPDPPVWYLAETAEGPVLEAESFTAWLERRIGRAIKRRYPLRDAHFRG